MGIKIGTTDIGKVYVGTTEIAKIYAGTQLVYSASPTPQPTLSNKIYGHTRFANNAVTIKVNGTSYSVTSDADKYFELDCSNISITSLNQCIYNQSSVVADVTFDIDTSNCTNFYSLVASCRNVTSIDCSKMDTSKATNLSSMFYDNRAATTIIPPAGGFVHASGMTNIQFMFFNCYLVTSLDLSDMGDCDNVVSMNGMFRGCSALQTLDLSGFYIDSANISMDNVFGGCSALASIKVTGCDASVVTALLSMLTASSLSFVQSGDYLVKQS